MTSLPLWLITFVFAVGKVQSRPLRLNSSDPFVSYGVVRVENQATYVKCDHIYGFFPCADNVGGFIFLIAIYQYLLVVGEKLVSDGSKKLFNILGTGIFGATLFQILKAFPSTILVIASGVFSSKEKAQTLVYTGVSTNVGATVFNLTFMWGICVIFGAKGKHENSTPRTAEGKHENSTPRTEEGKHENSTPRTAEGKHENSTPRTEEGKQENSTPRTEEGKHENSTPRTAEGKHENSTPRTAESLVLKYFQVLRHKGVTIDKKTNYTAGIMLLSLIPFVLVQLVSAFNAYFRRRIVMFTTLVVSVTLLLSYFTYQLWDPWIQERSLEYSKYENLLAAFLDHVQRHARGKLIDEQGRPDIQVIERLFSETDKDENKSITPVELENLITDMQSGKVKIDKDYAISEIMKAFDLNNDKRIELHEFIEGCKRWIEEAKKLAQSDDSTTKRNLHEVVQHYTKEKRDEIDEIEKLMAKILKHVESQALEAEHILKDDGNPNIERITEIFHQYDGDGNNFITRSELEKLISSVKYGEVQLSSNDSVTKVMKDFDKDGNDMIDKHEFVHGIVRWINEAIRVTNCKDKKSAIDEYDKIMWGEVEKLVFEVEKDGKINYKLLTRAFNKSLFQVILGIAMLAFCSRPLVNSIQKASEAIGMPSFLIPFVIVPVALNARMAIAAIYPASQKCSKTASLTFSEIYGGVIMNNIMGMTALLAIVCAKGLTWDYSAQVVVALVACAIMGLLALFSNTYPLWTIILAFSLYPSCVGLFYLLQ